MKLGFIQDNPPAWSPTAPGGRHRPDPCRVRTRPRRGAPRVVGSCAGPRSTPRQRHARARAGRPRRSPIFSRDAQKLRYASSIEGPLIRSTDTTSRHCFSDTSPALPERPAFAGGREQPRESSLNRTTRTETSRTGSELDRKPALSLHLAAFRYTPSGFRFRYRKVWGFKSLFVQ
jgi:hypothetical protein